MLCAMLLLLAAATPPLCRGLEVEVGRGQELCYHQPVARGETLTVQYEVAAASGHTANTDIDFRLARPGGEAVVVEYRRQAGHHEFAGGLLADGAIIYVESRRQGEVPAVPAHWVLSKEKSGGDIHARLYRRQTGPG